MSTNKNEWNKRHGFSKDAGHSKAEVSRVSKIPIRIINEVFKRGVGAFETNPQSVRPQVTSAEQWGWGRIYSFINKLEGKKKLNHDLDLAEKVLKKKR